MKTEHILIADHLLMRSAYATPQIHAHTAIHLLVASHGNLHCCIRSRQIETQALFIASDVPHTTASEDSSLLVFLFDETSQPVFPSVQGSDRSFLQSLSGDPKDAQVL